jgi:hypothetical protein
MWGRCICSERQIWEERISALTDYQNLSRTSTERSHYGPTEEDKIVYEWWYKEVCSWRQYLTGINWHWISFKSKLNAVQNYSQNKYFRSSGGYQYFTNNSEGPKCGVAHYTSTLDLNRPVKIKKW